MKRFLPDVNVWFALAVEEHRHHRAARQWLDSAFGTIGFLRLTQIGLLRLLTTAAPMGGKPLTNEQAWDVYSQFLMDGRIAEFADLPHYSHFQRYSSAAQSSPKLWLDAYLAGFATASGIPLVTFDQAMTQYGAPCVILT